MIKISQPRPKRYLLMQLARVAPQRVVLCPRALHTRKCMRECGVIMSRGFIFITLGAHAQRRLRY